ncbi:hypothetical protein MIDIC_390002 [Alphaproteobacteria bacterium]
MRRKTISCLSNSKFANLISLNKLSHIMRIVQAVGNKKDHGTLASISPTRNRTRHQKITSPLI